MTGLAASGQAPESDENRAKIALFRASDSIPIASVMGIAHT